MGIKVIKIMTREQLTQIGRTLYGPTWQTELARNIVNLDGKELDHRRVRQWACGARPVPDWLLPELKKLAAKKLDELEKLNIVLDKLK